ncbi:hypothetical protein AAG570_008385 [Ranatra chinensis]|uniref:Enoyl reductase (ER) domain-containing protein n=1 Tax=Ranatra chinensis TaxID=642074 RepID=A0ABD0YRC9_9HEMI
MTAWTVQSKRNSAKLDLTNVKTPHIRKPSEVIVKVLATSVNPIDIAMLDGYGNTVLDTIRQIDGTYDEFRPKILGRDFCGEIISKGNSVRSELSIGDIIYGVVTPHLQGCHAEQVVVDENMVCLKPNHLDINKAAGILYTALTAWSALKISGDLYLMPAKHKRILVVGASGGVGSAAVQLLKAWGAEVIATCRTDAMYLVGCLNPDMVIDYTNRDALHEIKSAGKYDIILDASGNINPATYIPFLKDWSNSKFITLRSPFLKNTDSYGLIVGMVRNVAEFVLSNAASGAPIKGSTIRWAFFAPIPAAVEEISGLVAANKVLNIAPN